MTDDAGRTGMREIVEGAIRETFPHHHGEIADGTSARSVLGWDSLSHVDLMLLIEEKIGRKLDVAQSFKLRDVGELVRFLEEGA